MQLTNQLMKNWVRQLYKLGICLALISVAPQAARAQTVQDFVITNFDAQYELTNEDPQGTLNVSESIELNYSAQNRGIIRAIPTEYKGVNQNVKILSVLRDGVDEPYVTYEENNNLAVRIGDVDTYITGKHNYVINYSLENVISFYEDYDEFYWDINGDQWLQVFESVSVELSTKAATKDGTDAMCFTGKFGSMDKNCKVSSLTNGLQASTIAPLRSGETLTVVQAYEKGYFTPPTFLDKYGKYIWFTPLIILQLAAAKWAYNRWVLFGKDYKSKGITAPYFGRPKNVSIMQASYVKDNRLLPKHISASIIDLSIRGYMRITEKKDGRKTTHELELLKPADNGLEKDEHLLIEGLFSSNKSGQKIELESKKNKLYKTSQKIANEIDSTLLSRGFYETSPKKAVGKITAPLVFSVATGLLGFMFAGSSGGLTLFTGLVSSAFVVILVALMTKRSPEGVLLVEHMEGLKLYLDKAEKERIKMQDAVAAPLAPRSGEPARDVKFFEKLLPFAVAAGVEKSWANAFKDIYQQPPDWYSGNWSTFNTVALASSLSDTAKVTSQSFTAPSSSGASGSGGGGFSGGGGGGGGGGGW
jgi:uncharacterized membrane protein YgcG